MDPFGSAPVGLRELETEAAASGLFTTLAWDIDKVLEVRWSMDDAVETATALETALIEPASLVGHLESMVSALESRLTNEMCT